MSRQTLPILDGSLYPQIWEQQTFTNPQSLIMAMLSDTITPDANAFAKQLLANGSYQEWINATVFGRYIQRNFAAFYRQTEDSFNVDMPAIFRSELLRHAQYLPLEQILFVASKIPKNTRQDKVLTTTINPATAVLDAQRSNKLFVVNNRDIVVNQIRVVGKQVAGFPIRHNKRTSERTRNEVLILDFNDLRLVNEHVLNTETKSNTARPEGITVLLRYYELR